MLRLVNNEFVVRGVYTFQSPHYLYFVMEYMPGGDLGTLLETVGALDEDVQKLLSSFISLF